MHAPSLVVEAFKRLDLGLSVVTLLGATGAAAVFSLVAWYVPFVALLLYGLMWSIYDRFDEVRAANETLHSQIVTNEERAALNELLGEALASRLWQKPSRTFSQQSGI